MKKVINFSLQKGKFYFGNINNYYNVDADIYLFCTTESPSIPDGTILVEQLAPSLDLYIQKKAWMDKGMLSDKYDEFKDLYLSEMNEREDYQKALNRIMEMAREGKSIVLFDDCDNNKYCHLNILKDELSNKGYRVDTIKDSNKSYDPLSHIRW